jgi:tricorn protease
MPQDGSGQAKQITRNAETYKYSIEWSPDGKKILWGDKRLRLRYVSIKSGKIIEVDQSEAWEFRRYSWSPDSRWIVYVKSEVRAMDKIYLYSLKEKKSFELTDGWYSTSNPVFGSDGKFVFFTSDRDFNPIYSRTEWNHAYQDMSRIYMVTLAKSTDSPFKPRSDEVEIKKKEKTKKPKSEGPDPNEDSTKGKKDKEKKKQKMKVDIDGIKDRIVVLPIEVSNYYNLSSVGDYLYYNRRSSKDNETNLLMYDLKERKETELGKISGYEISTDQKKMLVVSGGKYSIIDLPKSKIDIKETLDLSDMEVRLNKKKLGGRCGNSSMFPICTVLTGWVCVNAMNLW